MRKIFLLLLISISSLTFSNPIKSFDTISHWKVYRSKNLVKEGIVSDKLEKIDIYIKTIRVGDTLHIKYFEDTPCYKCKSKFIIKTVSRKTVFTLNSKENGYDLKVKTTDLQLLAAKNKTSIFIIYFKEDDKSDAIPLFKIEIK